MNRMTTTSQTLSISGNHSFDGSWELKPEDVRKGNIGRRKSEVVLHSHQRTASKYAVVGANGQIQTPLFPGYSISRKISAPANVPRPSQQKNRRVKKPDGTWMELPS